MEARFGQYGKAANGIAIINTVAENRIKNERYFIL